MALTISPNVPSRKPELFGVCIAFGSLTAITILLRLWARLKVLRVGLLLDDFTILIAAGLALYFCINVPQQTGFGLGYHIYDLTDPSYFSGSLKLFFVGELVYYLCVTFTKLSLLILYLRIFVPRGLRMITWVTMAFVSLTLVAFIFAVVFQCHPIEFAWDKSINGKCVNQTAIFYSHAGINILTDFVIYILPMKMLWGVLRPKKDKIGLVVVFAIGIFVCLAGIIRLWALQKTSISEDPSWDNEPSAVWSIIECCVGVICASVPSLKPLFNQSSNRVGSSIRLSERHTRSGGKGTQDLESLSGKWDVRISGRMNNDGVGRNESPTESVQSLFGLQTRPREGDDKTGIYTSRTVTISHADG